MKVLNYCVHNILKIADANLNLEGRHLFLIGGDNSQGKTSALLALAMALCSKKDFDWPDVALKDGEDEGFVRVNLSGDDELHEQKQLTVELKFRRKRGGAVVQDFRILDSTGEEAPEPRTLLKTLYQMRGFDPLAFERSKSKDRAQILRELLGLDFTELDKERADVYSARTSLNRDLKQKTGELEGVTYPTDTPDEPVSITQLMGELEAAKQHNKNIDEQRQSLVRLTEVETKLAEEEDRLKARLLEIEEERSNLDSEIENQEKVCESLEPKDESEIQKRIYSADETNRHVAAKQKAAELRTAIKRRSGEAQKMTDRLTEIDEEKQSRMEAADWPLENMSLDEAGVLLNGLPFEQASKAERVLASVKVGMALNPKLKLLICQDGNDLGNGAMAALEKVLEEHDFQLLLEYVTRDAEDESRCAVVFHDGAAKQPEQPDTVSASEV